MFLAKDERHDRHVALKVLRPELVSEIGAERFLREIRIAAGLTHPHILPLHDSGEVDGFLYYVMPNMEGQSLRERLEREGQLELDEALRITQEVASALEWLDKAYEARSAGMIYFAVEPAYEALRVDSRFDEMVRKVGLATRRPLQETSEI